MSSPRSKRPDPNQSPLGLKKQQEAARNNFLATQEAEQKESKAEREKFLAKLEIEQEKLKAELDKSFTGLTKKLKEIQEQKDNEQASQKVDQENMEQNIDKVQKIIETIDQLIIKQQKIYFENIDNTTKSSYDHKTYGEWQSLKEKATVYLAELELRKSNPQEYFEHKLDLIKDKFESSKKEHPLDTLRAVRQPADSKEIQKLITKEPSIALVYQGYISELQQIDNELKAFLEETGMDISTMAEQTSSISPQQDKLLALTKDIQSEIEQRAQLVLNIKQAIQQRNAQIALEQKEKIAESNKKRLESINKLKSENQNLLLMLTKDTTKKISDLSKNLRDIFEGTELDNKKSLKTYASETSFTFDTKSKKRKSIAEELLKIYNDSKKDLESYNDFTKNLSAINKIELALKHAKELYKDNKKESGEDQLGPMLANLEDIINQNKQKTTSAITNQIAEITRIKEEINELELLRLEASKDYYNDFAAMQIDGLPLFGNKDIETGITSLLKKRHSEENFSFLKELDNLNKKTRSTSRAPTQKELEAIVTKYIDEKSPEHINIEHSLCSRILSKVDEKYSIDAIKEAAQEILTLTRNNLRHNEDFHALYPTHTNRIAQVNNNIINLAKTCAEHLSSVILAKQTETDKKSLNAYAKKNPADKYPTVFRDKNSLRRKEIAATLLQKLTPLLNDLNSLQSPQAKESTIDAKVGLIAELIVRINTAITSAKRDYEPVKTTTDKLGFILEGLDNHISNVILEFDSQAQKKALIVAANQYVMNLNLGTIQSTSSSKAVSSNDRLDLKHTAAKHHPTPLHPGVTPDPSTRSRVDSKNHIAADRKDQKSATANSPGSAATGTTPSSSPGSPSSAAPAASVSSPTVVTSPSSSPSSDNSSPSPEEAPTRPRRGSPH